MLKLEYHFFKFDLKKFVFKCILTTLVKQGLLDISEFLTTQYKDTVQREIRTNPTNW